jgi:hypothetical protein
VNVASACAGLGCGVWWGCGCGWFVVCHWFLGMGDFLMRKNWTWAQMGYLSYWGVELGWGEVEVLSVCWRLFPCLGNISPQIFASLLYLSFTVNFQASMEIETFLLLRLMYYS